MICDLLIETLTHGGNGLGRLEGMAVFVPGTAPGDRIRCRIVKRHKRHAEGVLEELLVPSPQRREPPCPVAGLCGGCQWQHLDYAAQCAAKEGIFHGLMQRQGEVPAAALKPLVAAPAEWGYRSRVQFKCRQTEQGFVIGFYRPASHYVVDMAGCSILDPRIEKALQRVRPWLAEGPCPDRIPQVDMAVGDDGGVRLVVHAIAEDNSPLAAWLTPRAVEAGYALFLQNGRKDSLQMLVGPPDLTIEVDQPPLQLTYGPGGFAQVNLEQNRILVKAVLEAAALEGGERVLDLFCGMGNFSLPLARRAREVIGVEDYAPSIASAVHNAEVNGLANARFFACPAEGALNRLAAEAPFDLVLLDPPRSGAYAVMRELVKVRPQKILYISCDPATLARDLVPLQHGGYQVRSCQPFDLFPQSYHVESLTVLERQDPG